MGPKLFVEKIFLRKLFGCMYAGLGVIIIKKLFLAQKWVFRAIIEEALKNDSSWPKNHFFIKTTPKPAYIHPNNILRKKNSTKNFGPMGPLGVPGVPILGSPR